MVGDTLRLKKETNTLKGKNVPRVTPQLGGIAPSGVYAMPQKLFISRGSFMNELGSLGSVCGTADELVGVDELLLLLPLVAARLLFLLLFETATPTPTPIPIRARRPTIEPKIYGGCQNHEVGGEVKGREETYDPLAPARTACVVLFHPRAWVSVAGHGCEILGRVCCGRGVVCTDTLGSR